MNLQFHRIGCGWHTLPEDSFKILRFKFKNLHTAVMDIFKAEIIKSQTNKQIYNESRKFEVQVRVKKKNFFFWIWTSKYLNNNNKNEIKNILQLNYNHSLIGHSPSMTDKRLIRTNGWLAIEYDLNWNTFWRGRGYSFFIHQIIQFQ